MKAAPVAPAMVPDESIAPDPPTRSVQSLVHTPIRTSERDSMTLEPGQRSPAGDSHPLAMGMRGGPRVDAIPQTMPPTSATKTDPPSPDDDYEDETSTDRHHEQLVAAARSMGIDGLDEGAADHPMKTMRPPSAADIDVDIDFDPERSADPTTSRGMDVAQALALARSAKRATEEDETETMQLTPEIRARIEQMTRGASSPPIPPSSKKERHSSKPPPTRRLGNKPGR
jgi:hypothetical protein